MERYKTILAYDGSAFSGMQRQASERTVQGEVETSLANLGWLGRSILIAGRTDAGVHAEGQVVAFDLDWKHSEQDLQSALNASLPRDLAVVDISKVSTSFHPRYDATVRHYRYSIYCLPHRHPLKDHTAWRIWPQPDLSEMNHAGDLLVGEHDFAAFGTPQKKGGPTIRKVMSAKWIKETEEDIVFEIKANAYLYHMVRRIVASLLKVGRGLLKTDEIASYFVQPKGLVKEIAPAHGLSLTKVNYAD